MAIRRRVPSSRGKTNRYRKIKVKREWGCGGKRRYRSHDEAIEAMRRARDHWDGADVLPVRAYECVCGGWHLTSQP